MNMTQGVVILAEDDAGHARLIEKNLSRGGLQIPIKRFEDGQGVLDFLFCRGPGPHRLYDTAYLMLLDIRMPKVDGVEVLRQIKADAVLRKIPVIMLTTTDDPREIERCHILGCNSYFVKPVASEEFAGAIMQLARFLSLVRVPMFNERQRT